MVFECDIFLYLQIARSWIWWRCWATILHRYYVSSCHVHCRSGGNRFGKFSNFFIFSNGDDKYWERGTFEFSKLFNIFKELNMYWKVTINTFIASQGKVMDLHISAVNSLFSSNFSKICVNCFHQYFYFRQRMIFIWRLIDSRSVAQTLF